jgi:GrpB-like predicted nucleotidyltransferase (UPF0157 family)
MSEQVENRLRPLDASWAQVFRRVALRKRTGSHTNLHIVAARSWVAQRIVLFREALRADRQRLGAYARLKEDLAGSSETLLNYTLSETVFVEQVIRRRCEQTGVPYHPGNRR